MSYVEFFAENSSWLDTIGGNAILPLAVAGGTTAVAAAIGTLKVRDTSRSIGRTTERQIEEVRTALDDSMTDSNAGTGDPLLLDVAEPEDRVLQAMEKRSAERSEIQFQHYAAALRQSGIYFYISAVVAVLGFVLIVAGVSLSVASLVNPGLITTLTGLVAEGAAALVFRQAATSKKDSQDNLAAISEALEREDNRQMALVCAARITDPTLRDATLATLSEQSMQLSDPRQSTASANQLETDGRRGDPVPPG